MKPGGSSVLSCPLMSATASEKEGDVSLSNARRTARHSLKTEVTIDDNRSAISFNCDLRVSSTVPNVFSSRGSGTSAGRKHTQNDHQTNTTTTEPTKGSPRLSSTNSRSSDMRLATYFA